MAGRLLAFGLWVLCSLLFVGLGIFILQLKREAPFGFWANGDVFPVEDVRGYNRALGRLWCVFGAMAESIAAMGIYVLVIERKYRKK